MPSAPPPQPAYGGYSPANGPVDVTYGKVPHPSYAQAGPPQPGGPADARWEAAERATAEPAVSWHTAADEGWQAAASLAEDQDFTVTETGLPRRVPMSQLVPGGIDTTTTSTASHRRTPESVRGLLAAYHRGVQRGRTRSDDPKTPEPTSAGPQNSQGGKEQEG